jgi:DNA replication protein DnaC
MLAKFIRFCPTCCEKFSAEAKEREEKYARQQKENDWARICPPAYRDTEISKLPNPAKAVELMAWNYGKMGLLLHGKTRKGKSRCAWLLCQRVFMAGKSVKVLDAMAGFKYAAAFANSGREAEAWVDSYCRTGLLFFDDVFKVKLTDSFEAAVFAIVDYRMSHNLPILATLNDTGETLAARMSSDRGDAFVARLKEMCEVINF